MKRWGILAVMAICLLAVGEPLSEEIFVPKERFTAYTINPPGADLILDLKPADGYRILWHGIRYQDWADCVQWIKDDTMPNRYRLTVVYNGPEWPGTDVKRSSREWLVVTGGFERIVGGGSGNGTLKPLPLFEADVLAVDLDFADQSDPDLAEETREETVGAYGGVNGPLTELIIRKIECKEIPGSVLNKMPIVFSQESNRRVKIWRNPDKTGPINLPFTVHQKDLPLSVYVEPIEAGNLVLKLGCRFQKLANATGSEKRWVEAVDRVKMAAIKAEIKSISFEDAGTGAGGDNEHVLYANSSTLSGWGAGAAISDPVWMCDGPDADSNPDKNAPVCYTRSTTTVDSKMKIEVVLRAQPSGLRFDLIGLDGTKEYFRKNGETSSGIDQTISLVASEGLPSTVEKLAKTFTWKAIFTDPNPDMERLLQATTHDIYVVYSSPITTLTRPEGDSEENKPTPKRMDFCLVEAGTQGRGAIHGTATTSLAQQLQSHIANNIFQLRGFYQQSPTPSPIWTYIKTRKDGGTPKADCIQQSCMLAAGLGQIGIAAEGDRAYPSSDNDCSIQEVHPSVPGRLLRYVTDQNSDDTSTIGGAYLNNFQATAWVADENSVKKYYTMWPLFPPKDTLLAVLQYERSQSVYLQYWSYDGNPVLDPNRFVDEVLHPKRVPADWPPVWNNSVPLP